MRAIFTACVVLVFSASAAAQFANRPQKDLPPIEDAKPAAEAPAAVSNGPNPMFAAIDTDGDGVISKVEIKKAIVALKKLDADNDGNITLAEVGGGAAAGPGQPPAVAGDPLQAEIERLMAGDNNKDDKLTANEVPPEVMPLLQGADTNRDRAIDRQELAAAMQNAPNQFRNGPGAGGAPVGNGNPDEMTGRFVKQYDQNNDGKLSPQELPANMKRSFQAKDDLDNDGQISPAELQAVMGRSGGGRAWAAGIDPRNNQRMQNRGRTQPQP